MRHTPRVMIARAIIAIVAAPAERRAVRGPRARELRIGREPGDPVEPRHFDRREVLGFVRCTGSAEPGHESIEPVHVEGDATRQH
jgi:hypothetical protein